jgi:predicted dienelactone hydrolase
LLPVPRLPAPTGPYPVGTLTLDLTDLSRSDPYAPDPAAPRRLMVQVWYPAEAQADLPLAPWAEHMDILGPALGEFFSLPGFLFSQVRLARAHAYVDAPAAEAAAPYPLILFSHGWSGLRFQNTYQMEELASHGYVVAAVEHTYGAMTTVFSDGSVAGHNPAGLPFDLPEAEYRLAANRLVTQWAQDLAFVLDTLASLQADDPGGLLAGRLDLARVGVMGHSTGGGAAVEFCAADARCRAGLAMDAYLAPVTPAVIEQGALPQPFLWMRSEAWSAPGNTELADAIYANMSGPALAFTIQGTAHYDFTDLPMFTPLAPVIGLKGPLAGSRVLRIVNDYTLAFWGQALLGQPAPLLDGPSPAYPEVIFIER